MVFTVVFLVQFYGAAGIAVLIRRAFKKSGKFLVG
jgi:hypothetical protein